MSDLQFVFYVSRPRFWIYVFGPYLVGLAAAATSTSDFLRFDAVIFGLYFLLPANLLIYGINDIFDWETDRLNPKKGVYETLVRPESHRRLATWFIALNIPFLIAAIFLAPQALISLAGFLFFSIFYSAPPIRAKQIPVADSFFNILYVLPAAFAYQMITGSFIPCSFFAAAGLWTMAMHAYSAIPDIESDGMAGVSTVATAFGKIWTHVFCVLCYLAAIAFCLREGGPPATLIGVAYLFFMIYSLRALDDVSLFSFYRLFPFINAIAGFALFWTIAWPKFFSN